MDHRKAASVVPEPVGAAISVSSPRAIAGQPSACAAVGVPNRSRNQSATNGENGTSAGLACASGTGQQGPAAYTLPATKAPRYNVSVPAAPTSPAGRAKRNRAAARRDVRATPARPTAATAPSIPPAVLTAVWWIATGLFVVFTARSLLQKITWYLAVDQYGYLAFGHDLARGQVFHHWPPLDAFLSRIPEQVDILVQTYVYDHGKAYCRYAPGFPIILAAWLLLFGDDGAHYLNPTIFICLLLLVIAFQRRLFPSRWRPTSGGVLMVLFPSMLHLWGITLVRDLSTHLFAVLGLFLLLPVRGRPLAPGRTAAATLASAMRPRSARTPSST